MSWSPRSRTALLLVGLLSATCLCYTMANRSKRPQLDLPDEPDLEIEPPVKPAAVDRFFANGNLVVWWDRDKLAGTSATALTRRSRSNIHPQDYAGAETCQKCHPQNHAAWSQHSHRWMNALANEDTVKGDFSGSATIDYLGGKASFCKSDDGYQMQFARGTVRRTYDIKQTIGSRFFQYYVGTLASGPEAATHPAYHINHVMPFGYWIDRQQWVPAVHVGYDELPDGQREDPFAETLPPTPLSPYYQCNSCHTTFPLGDELTRNFWSLGRHAPVTLHWSMPEYLRSTHDELSIPQVPREAPNAAVEQLLIRMQEYEATEHAVNLGVSCEACHLGCQEHVANASTLPSFFPVSVHLHADAERLETGRTHTNVNWTCGRCHAGERPYYAGGMSTWNSTEYTDATKGSCYSQLKCVDCHNPHETIGKKWSRPAAEDDHSCLKCHEQFQSREALTQHTHHAADSEGSRCMNCHMPRINEGLQNVVRTHAIFSPTKPEMIEANQLNACNICHVEEPIDWTIGHLRKWYTATFDEQQIAANYPRRDQPTAIGWLRHDKEFVRLAATDAVARSRDRSTLPALIDVLDDPYLLNRQFARVALERKLDVRLADFGYQFYMTPQERSEPIDRIRRQLLSAGPTDTD